MVGPERAGRQCSNIDRCSGDLQSCFVLPELRGIGRALVRVVLATAHTRGGEHITVHASPDSVNVYVRNGFRASGQFLWADTTERDH